MATLEPILQHKALAYQIFLLVPSFILCGATTVVLCGATTLVLCETITLVLCGATILVLCGTTTIVLCGTHHPLWLPFHLFG
jgi:hypothetical protein